MGIGLMILMVQYYWSMGLVLEHEPRIRAYYESSIGEFALSPVQSEDSKLQQEWSFGLSL